LADDYLEVLRCKQKILLEARHAVRDGAQPADEFALGLARLKRLNLTPEDARNALADLVIETDLGRDGNAGVGSRSGA
jgi:hypothetical protein